MSDSLKPVDITEQAVGDIIKLIAEDLNVHRSWIYRICSEAEHDPYSRFIALYEAVARRNSFGAQLYFHDFEARHVANTASDLPSVLWEEALAEAMTEAQAMFAEGVTKGPAFEVKAIKTIMRIRTLLAQLRKGSK